ncbi:hypothetical protein BVY04_02925 [bacterium M21]|nr:hypothetical protein BVY04_02925 [bacterium M21]
MTTTAEPTDQMIINRVLKGDLNAYEQLVIRYELQLQASLARLCRDTHEVQKVAHDAFVHAYQKLKTYNSEYPFYPWVRTIAVNLVRQDVRRRDRRQSIVDTYITDIRERYAADVVMIKESDRLHALRDCIQGLPAEQQEMLTKRYQEQTPVTDLAEQIGRKTGAVKMQLHRLRGVLKQCIQGKMHPEGAS